MIDSQIAFGAHGVVVSGHQAATNEGVNVLRGGGNAVDAAVAAALVLAVVCPYASTVGGDAYVLIFDAGEDRLFGLNGTGKSPARANLDTLSREVPLSGILSATVPGMLAGLDDALGRFGTRGLAALLAPAIRYAKEGFAVHRVLARNIRERAALLAHDGEAAAIFLPDGVPLPAGERLVQADLARTLERIAEGGARALYEGELAEEMVTAGARLGGIIGEEDLAAHESRWQEPVAAPFHDHAVATMPPNSYGLTLLLQLLQLAADDIASVAPDSADFILRGYDARRRAYAAAAEAGAIGDPGSAEPAARALLRRVAGAGGRLSHDEAAGGAEAGGGCTTSVVAMDGAGNAVSLIQSVSAPFGSGVVLPGTGVVMNNRMAGFVADPASPNCVGPQRRPAHTLAPCMVLRDGKPRMAVGTPGAVGQTCTLAQFLARTLACGESVGGSVSAPRWSVDFEGGLIVESAMDPRRRDEVAARAPKAGTKPDGWLTFGSIKVAMRDGERFMGVADPRRAAGAAAF